MWSQLDPGVDYFSQRISHCTAQKPFPYQCAKDTVQGGSEPYPSGRSLEVRRGQRHTFDAVPDHCRLQAGLRLHCVWHSIEYQFTTTGQHSKLWIETGIGSILYQPNLQPVHIGHGSAEINAELVCPLGTPSFPPGTHDYDLKRYDLIEGVSKCWRGCNHPTSNWPYQGHQIPYLVPRTANWLSPLWSNTDHMLLECASLQECRDEYYTVDSLNALFETIPETCIVEFLQEAGFFYLIWCNLLTSTSPQTFTIWSDLSNYLDNESNSETHLLV